MRSFKFSFLPTFNELPVLSLGDITNRKTKVLVPDYIIHIYRGRRHNDNYHDVVKCKADAKLSFRDVHVVVVNVLQLFWKALLVVLLNHIVAGT